MLELRFFWAKPRWVEIPGVTLQFRRLGKPQKGSEYSKGILPNMAETFRLRIYTPEN